MRNPIVPAVLVVMTLLSATCTCAHADALHLGPGLDHRAEIKGAGYSVPRARGARPCNLPHDIMRIHATLIHGPSRLTFLSSSSADDTSAKAAAAGAKILAPPFDVMDFGRMAVIQDPAGAVFCIWQAKNTHWRSLRESGQHVLLGGSQHRRSAARPRFRRSSV